MLGGAFCLAVTVRSGNQCSASRSAAAISAQPGAQTCLSTSNRHARTLSLGGFWQMEFPTR
jgi:hypothetical protein